MVFIIAILLCALSLSGLLFILLFQQRGFNLNKLYAYFAPFPPIVFFITVAISNNDPFEGHPILLMPYLLTLTLSTICSLWGIYVIWHNVGKHLPIFVTAMWTFAGYIPLAWWITKTFYFGL